jgi:transglutaminase-like putative cysteine protease
MKLSIRHETVYRYTAPLLYSIQQLRLTPRNEVHQRTQSWQITTIGNSHMLEDAFGNICHMLTTSGKGDEQRIAAHGIVDVDPLDCGRLLEKDVLSPLVFATPTRLTELTPAIIEFAAHHLPNGTRSASFLELAEAVCDAIQYQSGTTNVASVADDALRLGSGVCQDHAHVFLACCRAQGIPARYVSGYIDPGQTEHAQSHAWVDVWVEEVDFSGWVSIDVTHAQYVSDLHCRLAIGRDYESAAPVRGVRRGGGIESLSVQVDVASLA